MPYWWEKLPDERYWCEITDRRDLGADLKCPQRRENGRPDWSYSLINDIWPGDVVFHYSTRAQRIEGASVAGGPVEERPIVWSPHGTVGRSKKESRPERAGWWRPLYSFTTAAAPLTLRELHAPGEDAWIRTWITEKERTAGQVYAPFQRYKGKLRAAQGYLAKMPKDFVERWPALSDMAERLAGKQEELTTLGEVYPGAAAEAVLAAAFKPKSDEDYLAVISASVQRRSRTHERLVRIAGEYLRAGGAEVATPHPIDLLMTKPVQVIFEAKPVSRFGALFAVRQAVGQLFEYRRFIGPRQAKLCILLDQEPAKELVEYVEGDLGLLIAWLSAERLAAGPATVSQLPLG
jgi:hypothetical protein